MNMSLIIPGYSYRPLARLWECSQSEGQNKRNFHFKKLIVLYSRLAAVPQMCKGSILECCCWRKTFTLQQISVHVQVQILVPQIS